MATALIESVLHWRKKLDKYPDDEYVLNVIRKLSKVPMTLEILEATHIGKSIRKLSKRKDPVGEKAMAILNKWRESFASQECDRNKPVPNDSKKENVSSKHPSQTKQSLKNNSTESHSKYAKNSMDYDPHTEISEAYNPECPALFSTDNPVKKKKPILVETYVPSSVKRKLIYKKEQNETKSQQKKVKSSNILDTVVDSMTHNSNKEKTKDKKNSSSSKTESEKVFHSSKKEDCNAKKTKSSKSDKTKSKKTDLKILSSEEFTASEVSFEDCLGLNDIVCLKKHSSVKKQSSSSTPSKQKPTEKCKIKSTKTASPNGKVKDLSYHSDKRKASAIPKTKDSSRPDENTPFTVPKPEKQLSVDISSTLPKISNMYIPRSYEISEPKRKVPSEADAINFLSSRKERTAVYSGRRAHYGPTGVPSLLYLCQRLLMDYLDAIQCIGDTPFHVIFPVLEKCSPHQLFNIEKHNQHIPDFLDETDILWQRHCQKVFKMQKRADHETWRDLYLRAKDEEDQKFKTVTQSISRSMLKSAPVRQTKLAYVESLYVKPPRDILKKQAKNGTAVAVNPIKQNVALKKPRPTSLPSGNCSGSTSKKPKPPAPLMAKTLKLIKGYRRK